VGCGPSLLEVTFPRADLVVACNRAIEFVAADCWIWVDRMHYDRSSWHPNARRAERYGPFEFAQAYAEGTHAFRLTRRLPAEEGELYLRGGTLVPAAHLAIRLGASELVFAACDGWSSERRRWYGWDARELSSEGRETHQLHLAETAAGIRDLMTAHPAIEFRDATEAAKCLGLPAWEETADAKVRSCASGAR
jgi:hypothetical protein